jgi:hypothetical protein
MNEVISYTIQFLGALGCEVQGFFRLFLQVFSTIKHYLSLGSAKRVGPFQKLFVYSICKAINNLAWKTSRRIIDIGP